MQHCRPAVLEWGAAEAGGDRQAGGGLGGREAPVAGTGLVERGWRGRWGSGLEGGALVERRCPEGSP